MKLLLVADKEESYIWDHFEADRFKDIDLMISCGDLKAEYLSFLVTMISKPLFYVPGNHDKTYADEPPEGCDNIDGQVIEYNGMRIAGFGGSMRYNIGSNQYNEEEMKKRIDKVRKKIKRLKGLDIIVTHAPARGLGDGRDLCHTGFQCFTDLIDELKPSYFLHGHYHLNYGKVERIIHRPPTEIINAYGYYILDTEKPL